MDAYLIDGGLFCRSVFCRGIASYLAEACSVWTRDIEQLIAGGEFSWTAEACAEAFFARKRSFAEAYFV